MRLKHNLYDYIAVYVDDLAIAAHDTHKIISLLEDIYKFKLKGTGDITYHLGIDFHHNKYGVLCMSTKKYIKKYVSLVKESLDTHLGQSTKHPLTRMIIQNLIPLN